MNGLMRSWITGAAAAAGGFKNSHAPVEKEILHLVSVYGIHGEKYSVILLRKKLTVIFPPGSRHMKKQKYKECYAE